MAGWKICVKGSETSRITVPELWDDMYRRKYIDKKLKQELMDEFPKLREKEKEWGLILTEDEYCYLVCFVDGLEYRNMGTGWSFTGGAEIAKRIYGKRLRIVK